MGKPFSYSASVNPSKRGFRRLIHNIRRELSLKDSAFEAPGLLSSIGVELHPEYEKSNISRLESGEKVSFPTLSTISKYANALGYKVKLEFEHISQS